MSSALTVDQAYAIMNGETGVDPKGDAARVAREIVARESRRYAIVDALNSHKFAGVWDWFVTDLADIDMTATHIIDVGRKDRFATTDGAVFRFYPAVWPHGRWVIL